MKLLTSIFFIFCCVSLNAKEVTILLIRHGETDWNLEKRVQGQTDIPLNSTGIQQAKLTAKTLIAQHPDIQAIYSSDLSRAYQTAEETANLLNLPIKIHPGLRELDTGIAEGMLINTKVQLYQQNWKQLEEQYPIRRERWNYSPIPGEENINALIKRVKHELIQISQESAENAKVAVFSHKKAIQALIADIEDRDLQEIDVPNCAVIMVVYRSSGFSHHFAYMKRWTEDNTLSVTQNEI